jgi:hypothetical protein
MEKNTHGYCRRNENHQRKMDHKTPGIQGAVPEKN